MMISPETYYEDNLKGKSASEIITVIRSLKQEIGRLKNIKEHPDYHCAMRPSEETRIWCNRMYLERAKEALLEVGCTYNPSKAEEKAAKFDANIPFISKVEFCIGGFFDGYETKTYTIDGNNVKTEISSTKFQVDLPKDENDEEMDKETLFEGLFDLHIGEWRRTYDPGRFGYAVLDGTQWHLYIYYSNGHRTVKIGGSNVYPYNFNRLLELFDIELPDK